MAEHSKQFIYVLKLVPRLHIPDNWTERDNEAAEAHFKALQGLLKDGKLVLAGRTLESEETTFGIVILQTVDEEEARRLMENDPAVKGGIMTAELHPYHVALMSNEPV
ncbi:MAG TPA: YciI family protein [Bacillales bacterium]|nr:YciI family protein [Bacillales bacterium]